MEGRTVVAGVALGEPISLVFLLALGAFNIDRRVRAAVADVGWAMHRHFDPEDDAAHSCDLAKGKIKVFYFGTPSNVPPVSDHVRRDTANATLEERLKDVDFELVLVLVKT